MVYDPSHFYGPQEYVPAHGEHKRGGRRKGGESEMHPGISKRMGKLPTRSLGSRTGQIGPEKGGPKKKKIAKQNREGRNIGRR